MGVANASFKNFHTSEMWVWQWQPGNTGSLYRCFNISPVLKEAG
jgi:hypothetical protein